MVWICPNITALFSEYEILDKFSVEIIDESIDDFLKFKNCKFQ